MERSEIRVQAPVRRNPSRTRRRRRPIGGQQTAPDKHVKRRIWPVAHPTNQLVLDRIEVDVVDVPLEIKLVPYRVLPKAPLPKCVSAIAMALDRRAGAASRCVRCAFIRFQRPEKSASPDGSVQMTWRCSGRIAMSSIVKDARAARSGTPSARRPASSPQGAKRNAVLSGEASPGFHCCSHAGYTCWSSLTSHFPRHVLRQRRAFHRARL